MRAPLASALVLALSAPLAASAAELVLGVDAETRYDTNVFRVEADVDDYSAKAGPTLRLRERKGPAKYDFLLRSQYQQYYDTRGVSDFDYYGQGSFDWEISERTTFSFDDTFFHTPSLIQRTVATEASIDPSVTSILQQGHEYFTTNDFTATLSHLFTPRLRLESHLSNYAYEPHGQGQTSNLTFVGDTALLFALAPNDQVGGGFSITDQGLTPESASTSHTRFYQMFGSWTHQFDPTFDFSVQAGPTMVDNDTPKFGSTSGDVILTPFRLFDPGTGPETLTIDLTSCPVVDGSRVLGNGCAFDPTTVETKVFAFFNQVLAFSVPDSTTAALDVAQQIQTGTGALPISAPPKVESSSLTYFASASLNKRWRNVVASINYRRTAGTSSGLSVSSVLDSVYGNVSWQPSPLWYLSFAARFDRRTASADQLAQIVVLDDSRQFTTSVLPAFPFAIPGVATQSSIRLEKISSDSRIDGVTFFATANRRFSRRLVGVARFTYQTQKNTVKGFTSSKYDEWLASLGVQWEFEPIQIPFL